MTPAFVVGGLYHRANGITWIMRDLALALGRRGIPVSIYAAECPRPGLSSIGDLFPPPCRWIGRPGRWLGGLSWSPRLSKTMVKDSSQLDLFHHHSLWMLPNHYASVVGRRHNKPSLFTIHGALEPWALSHSYWKKQLIGRWFQFRDLREATCLHVNSRKELEQLRKLGFRQPIAMIPNGINPSEFLNLKKNQELSTAYPRLQGKRLVLFMARLHQKKGIEHLLQAWSRITAEFADWHLVLAGPDDGFELAARKLVGQLSIGDSVSLVGQLQGNMRLAALAEAHVFTQPSHSEGFSMSILEAMASGLPVLLTPGCNFPEVATAGAGIEVASDVEGTEMGLRAILGKSDEERQTMGAQGKMLIEKHFTWDRVAEQTEKLYRWLLGTSQKPAFVET